jgi:hypothetical protein
MLYEGNEDLFDVRNFTGGSKSRHQFASGGLLCDPRPGETWWMPAPVRLEKRFICQLDAKTRVWSAVIARPGACKGLDAAPSANSPRAVLWDGGEDRQRRRSFTPLVDAPCAEQPARIRTRADDHPPRCANLAKSNCVC